MQQGNLSNVEWFRGIGAYKIDFGAGWRIYLARDGIELIVLLGGGSKKGQQKDIDRAIVLWQDYKRRKARSVQPATSHAKNGGRNDAMALTRDFKKTVVARVENDPEFAKALLDEAATLFLNGEPDTAKYILRDLVNATIGFEQLAQSVERPSKSVHRMLSPAGNPTMSNLAAIFAALKNAMKVELQAHAVRVS